MKKIAILGSTGSIGRQTLQVIEQNGGLFKVQSLVAFSNEKLLEEQQKKYGAEFCAAVCRCGEDCLTRAIDGADVVVVATRGIAALPAVLKALDQGKTVALANKESLVCGGELIKQKKGDLITLDSEHSAIWQCLQGNDKKQVKKIVLTASGGAFRDLTTEQLKTVTAEAALMHPTWNMGAKITIDSATMMNKGLEIIEASYLFDIPQDKIDVLIHPQSIVHSMVEFCDGSVMAQLSTPDMRLPIQYALTYPDRVPSPVPPLDLAGKKLEFCRPDPNKFKCVSLCRQAFARKGLYPTVLNAANEVCVESFLHRGINFLQIADIVEKVLDSFCADEEVTVKNIFATDKKAKEFTRKLLTEK